VLYFRDEAVWSPGKGHIALAYTITEASMMNDIGCVLWGSVADDHLTIFQNPAGVYACCWRSPWCAWHGDDLFVFKLQFFDGKAKRIPLVAIHLARGFAVVPNSNTTDVWIDAAIPSSLPFTPFSPENLRDEALRCS
jgi:hypothetical protein